MTDILRGGKETYRYTGEPQVVQTTGRGQERDHLHELEGAWSCHTMKFIFSGPLNWENKFVLNYQVYGVLLYYPYKMNIGTFNSKTVFQIKPY